MGAGLGSGASSGLKARSPSFCGVTATGFATVLAAGPWSRRSGAAASKRGEPVLLTPVQGCRQSRAAPPAGMATPMGRRQGPGDQALGHGEQRSNRRCLFRAFGANRNCPRRCPRRRVIDQHQVSCPVQLLTPTTSGAGHAARPGRLPDQDQLSQALRQSTRQRRVPSDAGRRRGSHRRAGPGPLVGKALPVAHGLLLAASTAVSAGQHRLRARAPGPGSLGAQLPAGCDQAAPGKGGPPLPPALAAGPCLAGGGLPSPDGGRLWLWHSGAKPSPSLDVAVSQRILGFAGSASQDQRLMAPKPANHCEGACWRAWEREAQHLGGRQFLTAPPPATGRAPRRRPDPLAPQPGERRQPSRGQATALLASGAGRQGTPANQPGSAPTVRPTISPGFDRDPGRTAGRIQAPLSAPSGLANEFCRGSSAARRGPGLCRCRLGGGRGSSKRKVEMDRSGLDSPVADRQARRPSLRGLPLPWRQAGGLGFATQRQLGRRKFFC